jgi:hypothetical protein
VPPFFDRLNRPIAPGVAQYMQNLAQGLGQQSQSEWDQALGAEAQHNGFWGRLEHGVNGYEQGATQVGAKLIGGLLSASPNQAALAALTLPAGAGRAVGGGYMAAQAGHGFWNQMQQNAPMTPDGVQDKLLGAAMIPLGLASAKTSMPNLETPASLYTRPVPDIPTPAPLEQMPIEAPAPPALRAQINARVVKWGGKPIADNVPVSTGEAMQHLQNTVKSNPQAVPGDLTREYGQLRFAMQDSGMQSPTPNAAPNYSVDVLHEPDPNYQYQQSPASTTQQPQPGPGGTLTHVDPAMLTRRWGVDHHSLLATDAQVRGWSSAKSAQYFNQMVEDQGKGKEFDPVVETRDADNNIVDVDGRHRALAAQGGRLKTHSRDRETAWGYGFFS